MPVMTKSRIIFLSKPLLIFTDNNLCCKIGSWTIYGIFFRTIFVNFRQEMAFCRDYLLRSIAEIYNNNNNNIMYARKINWQLAREKIILMVWKCGLSSQQSHFLFVSLKSLVPFLTQVLDIYASKGPSTS